MLAKRLEEIEQRVKALEFIVQAPARARLTRILELRQKGLSHVQIGKEIGLSGSRVTQNLTVATKRPLFAPRDGIRSDKY